MNRPVGMRLAAGVTLLGACAMVLAATAAPLEAQRGGRGQGPSPAAAAPIDLTGYWVAIVNEDWRWRMVTPPRGDYASVPLNQEGRRVADQWQPSQDGACEAYGAAGLLRMPLRLRISWESDDVLNIETDAGQQIRQLRFGSGEPGDRTLQGHSVAEWVQTGGGAGPRAGGPRPIGGHLKVTTTSMLPGWLRRNGVPYSESAVLTEHFDRFAAPNGDEWLMVTAIVEDPRYLTQSYVTSSHFKLETDLSRWSPEPCGTR
jgi:hypothetical protein